MDKNIFLEILARYNKGEANEQEIAMLQAYYGLFEAQENVLDQMQVQHKDNLKQQILAGIKQQAQAKPKSGKLQLGKKWLAAAAILIVVFSVTLLLTKKAVNNEIENQQVQIATVIKPGSNQAILTLADGSTIGLNDKENGVILANAGLTVTKSEDGLVKYAADGEITTPSINAIATPRGGQYQLVLDDGTKVWLNAASSIKFPTHFVGKQRVVDITGEVYFEVAKNKAMPFIVRTLNQQIEVLGTHFNVNSYNDEAKETTTLLEGSVKVARVKNGSLQQSSFKMLVPGQEASLSASNNAVLVNIADTEGAVAWKNGYFKFDKADIATVMRQIARWYNVDVKYEGAMSEDLFVGKIKRTEDIKGVLRILELSKINTSIKGRTIVITN